MPITLDYSAGYQPPGHIDRCEINRARTGPIKFVQHFASSISVFFFFVGGTVA